MISIFAFLILDLRLPLWADFVLLVEPMLPLCLMWLSSPTESVGPAERFCLRKCTDGFKETFTWEDHRLWRPQQERLSQGRSWEVWTWATTPQAWMKNIICLGATMHCSVSGITDHFAKDEEESFAITRWVRNPKNCSSIQSGMWSPPWISHQLRRWNWKEHHLYIPLRAFKFLLARMFWRRRMSWHSLPESLTTAGEEFYLSRFILEVIIQILKNSGSSSSRQCLVATLSVVSEDSLVSWQDFWSTLDP